ncbi:IS3 family transposase [Streptomyces sp. NPDC087908]|uniref:IS3 family transposase n=1 Tax=Streptomyces sp. NPDC087908 TaxID=3365820 RepID=UPI003809F6D1
MQALIVSSHTLWHAMHASMQSCTSWLIAGIDPAADWLMTPPRTAEPQIGSLSLISLRWALLRHSRTRHPTLQGRHANDRDGLTSSDGAELAVLRRENRRLREGRGPQACDGFLRDGDPVNVHPFIEAEKTAGHSVKKACEFLEVSRTAYYARRTGVHGPCTARGAELTERIPTVHQPSRGTYGSPRIHAVLKREGAGCGPRRVARLMRQPDSPADTVVDGTAPPSPTPRPPHALPWSSATSRPPRQLSIPMTVRH